MSSKKLGLFALMFVVIGSMIGGGAFNLPMDMASSAGTGAVLIGWLITGVGIISLALVYQNLVNRKPELNGGIYSYAKEGFGHYMGFNSAWGYWMSAVVGNVAYATLLFGAVGYFFPSLFGTGETVWALLGASVLLWSVHFLILKGIKEAALVNVVTTIGKLVPIVLFIIVALLAFNFQKFNFDFWGSTMLNEDGTMTSIMDQVKNTMLVTLWVFIGVEGAVVLSSRAENRKDVGKATVLGLLATLIIYVLISVLAVGVMSRADLAGLAKPSMAYVLESIVGSWGAAIINIGLIISLLGAWLGWTLLSAEIPWVAAKDKVFPNMFTKENKNGSPAVSLWVTNGLTQLFLLVSFWATTTNMPYNPYTAMYSLATTAILMPYLLSALYGMKVSVSGETYDVNPKGRIMDIILATLSTVYAGWLVYAAGVDYLLLCAVLYVPGLLVYIWARKEAKEKSFTMVDAIFAVLLMGVAAYAIYQISIGAIAL